MARVLSVQSHVVSGYVGNKAAVFPLQTLGFNVDPINSVQFSNHTGYPVVKGSVVSGADIVSLFEGLESNDLCDYDYLLSGYIGAESFLDSLMKCLTRLKVLNPALRYVCDPVLGDDGRCYVPEALVSAFRDKVIPRAYIVTPNQFELQLLTDMKTNCEAEVIAALIALHRQGPPVVVLTSCEFECSPGQLYCYCLDTEAGSVENGSSSTSDHTTDTVNSKEVESSAPVRSAVLTRLTVQKLAGYYSGTGDLTAALLLAWNHRLGSGRSGEAMLSAISGVQAVLKNTIEIQSERRKQLTDCKQSVERNSTGAGNVDARERRLRELCLIESRHLLEAEPDKRTYMFTQQRISVL